MENRAADTGSEVTSSLRVRKAQRTRTELIRTAVELCLTLGYENTTVELIAAAVDISPRTFSRYFATKDAVFLALLDALTDDIAAEICVQPDHLGPLETLRAANVAVLTRVADRPYGHPSAQDIALILRVVNSSDALRRRATEYRNARIMANLADRERVPVGDRRLQLATTLFNVAVVTACANLVADVDPALLGPRLMIERTEEVFAQVAQLAIQLRPGEDCVSDHRVGEGHAE